MRIFANLDELAAAVGEHLGYSEWHTVTQQQVDQFAEATGDHQWIHVDPRRAASGPFGATIAHGYLTLSLIPVLSSEIYTVKDVRIGINYGSNKVRFPRHVPVGARIRAGAELLSVTPVAQGRQIVTRYVVEIEGEEKPACVAETVTLLAG
ncbi:MAG TPA: MaoC family dehydratase [Micromonosporaceae bacterium]